MTMLVFVIITFPLLLSFGGFHHRLRPFLVSLAPWSALPALIWALWNPPQSTFEISWLFIGVHLELDPLGRNLIIAIAVLWMLVGLSARASFASGPTIYRFFIVYLIMLTGMFGLFLAQDLPTFTLCYALITFAAYGLIIFEQTVAAHRAGLAYLMLAVIGEMVLLEGILHIAFIADDPSLSRVPAVVAAASDRHLITGLLLAGFGIKIGIFPLHVWIPMAYSAIPNAISAVLSGSMLIAGFLGWMRLLPIGIIALPEWGVVCMLAGLITLSYGVGVGLTQKLPKTILAYSTVSQAGLLTTGFGMGMVTPDRWIQIAPLLTLIPLHHAMALGALYLGLDAARKTAWHASQPRLVGIGLVVSALPLIGAPFSTGALSHAIFELPAPPEMLGNVPLTWLSGLGLFGMTLLMGHFFYQAWPGRSAKPTQSEERLTTGIWLPWAALLFCGQMMVWAMPLNLSAEAEKLLLSPMAVWTNLWPIVIGGLLVWLANKKFGGFPAPAIPPGDLIAGVEWVSFRAKSYWQTRILPAWKTRQSEQGVQSLLPQETLWPLAFIEKMEEGLGQWMTLGAALLFLASVFFVILIAL